ncbi:hypothetical protein HK097_002238 [Rhizophlyctis rosea]|uniref:Uncharacterized protein n=1 Tax=Rhizophlyctis rosea TaxID=64517 RepID=A0AAD5X1C6_9FUNG|nr:hypothetical protein HK097_002238 [Rhizophlyctis rosea]
MDGLHIPGNHHYAVPEGINSFDGAQIDNELAAALDNVNSAAYQADFMLFPDANQQHHALYPPQPTYQHNLVPPQIGHYVDPSLDPSLNSFLTSPPQTLSDGSPSLSNPTLSPPQVVLTDDVDGASTTIVGIPEVNVDYSGLGLDPAAGLGVPTMPNFQFTNMNAYNYRNVKHEMEDDRSSIFTQDSDVSDALDSELGAAVNRQLAVDGWGSTGDGFLAPPTSRFYSRRASTGSLGGFDDLSLDDSMNFPSTDLLSTSAPTDGHGFPNVVLMTSPMIRAIPSPSNSPLLTPHSPQTFGQPAQFSLGPPADASSTDIDEFFRQGSTEDLPIPPLDLSSNSPYQSPQQPIGWDEQLAPPMQFPGGKSLEQMLEEFKKYDQALYANQLQQLQALQKQQQERRRQQQEQQQQQQQQQQRRRSHSLHHHPYRNPAPHFTSYPSPDSPATVSDSDTQPQQQQTQQTQQEASVPKGVPVPPRMDIPELPKPRMLMRKGPDRQTLYQCPFPECLKSEYLFWVLKLVVRIVCSLNFAICIISIHKAV